MLSNSSCGQIRAHSCQYCQKLILDLRQDRWSWLARKKNSSQWSEESEHILKTDRTSKDQETLSRNSISPFPHSFLSIPGRKDGLKQQHETSITQQPSLTSANTEPSLLVKALFDSIKELGENVIESLQDSVVFDFTLAEMKEAAANGCHLCRWLRQKQGASDLKAGNELLLGARYYPDSDVLQFGKPEVKANRKTLHALNYEKTVKVTPFSQSKAVAPFVQLVAPAGKSSTCCSTSREFLQFPLTSPCF